MTGLKSIRTGEEKTDMKLFPSTLLVTKKVDSLIVHPSKSIIIRILSRLYYRWGFGEEEWETQGAGVRWVTRIDGC